MSDSGWPGRIAEWVRRRERAMAVGYLVVVGAVVIAFIASPVRTYALERLEIGLRWWEGRWTTRLAEGARLVAARRWPEAVVYLEHLDRIHPATTMRHGRDKDREHLLTLLGQAYEGLGRKTRALETYQRLALFDPRHYRNMFVLAEASDRLLSGALMAPEARDAYAAVLQMFPVHLPSLRGYVKYYIDHGDYQPVVPAVVTYLDAYLAQGLELRIGSAQAAFPAIVDGRMRDYEISIEGLDQAGGPIVISTGGFPIMLERVELVGASVAGRTTETPAIGIDHTTPDPVGFERTDSGAYRPRAATSALRLVSPPLAAPVAVVRLRLALYKPVDRALWQAIAKSYRNTLRDADLAEVARRLVVIETPAAADAVVLGTGWAKEGQFVVSR